MTHNLSIKAGLTQLEIPDAVEIPRGYPDALLWGVGLAAINDVLSLRNGMTVVVDGTIVSFGLRQ